MSNYTRWYREGTVSGSAGSNTVNGTGTYWKTAGLNTGDILKLGGNDYEILSVKSDTQLTISGTLGNAAANSSYSIIRNFTSTPLSKIASDVAGLLNDYARFLNTEMATIYGKSAYEIAKANGFTGTEAEWLSSLIGAGQWDTLNARTAFINDAENSNALYCAGFHNSIFRGKYLGNSVTAAQYSAIANGTFADLFIGDYWDIGGTRYRIAHFDYYFNQPGHQPEGFEDMNGDVLPAGSAPVYRNTFPPHHIVVMPDVLGNMPIATADTRTQLYGTCYYRLNGRREIISTLSSAFGADHLMYWIDNFTITMRAVNDGSYRSGTRASFVCQAELPSSIQLTGTPAVMSSGIPCMEGGSLNENRIGGGQFALCRLVPAFVRGVNSTGAYYIDGILFTRDITHVDADGKITFGSINKQSIVNYLDPTVPTTIRPYFCLKG